MSDLQYGDTFELQGLGYEGSIALPAVGGYLAFDTSKYAVTTDSPVATWKFESQDGKKKGSVMVGDVVKVVNVTPKSTAGHALQAVKESNAKAYEGKDPSGDADSLTWHIFGMENPASPSGTPLVAAPIAEGAYICLSSCLAAPPYVSGGNSVGEFLCIQGAASGEIANAKELYMAFTRQLLDAGHGGDTWWKVTNIKPASSSPAPSPSPSHSPSPSPALTTGKKCCFDIPAHTDFTVAYTNEEKWTRTVMVYIDQKPASIPVPVGHSTGSKNFVSGPGTATEGGKSRICIEIEDSQSGQMLLGWRPPVAVGDSKSIHIGAEKNYPSGGDGSTETRFNDMVVTVSWVDSKPAGSAS